MYVQFTTCIQGETNQNVMLQYQAHNHGEEGKAFPAFFENRKKCFDFGKQAPIGSIFELNFIEFYRSHNSVKPPLPRKSSGCVTEYMFYFILSITPISFPISEISPLFKYLKRSRKSSVWFESTVKALKSGHLRVLKNLSVIERCPLLGGNLKKIVTFGTKCFVHYSWHVRYLGYPLLGGFTLFVLSICIVLGQKRKMIFFKYFTDLNLLRYRFFKPIKNRVNTKLKFLKYHF